MTPPPPISAASPVEHWLDDASPRACGTNLAMIQQLRQLGGGQQRLLLLGRADLARKADLAGAGAGARRVGVPGGLPMLGLPAIRRHLRRGRPAEAIWCWSVGALAAARVLRQAVPRLLVLTQPITPSEARTLHRLTRWSGRLATQVLAVGDAVQASWAASDLPATSPWALQPMPPLGPDSRERPDTQALRHRWGIRDDRTRVAAMLNDPSTAGDCRTAALGLALARQTLIDRGQPTEIALLVHPRQYRRPAALKQLAQLDHPVRLVQEPGLETPWHVLPGCDLAIHLGPTAGGPALGWAMAAGCPILADPALADHPWIAHEQTALLAPDRKHRSLGHGAYRLLADAAFAARCSRQAAARLAEDDAEQVWARLFREPQLYRPAPTGATAGAVNPAG